MIQCDSNESLTDRKVFAPYCITPPVSESTCSQQIAADLSEDTRILVRSRKTLWSCTMCKALLSGSDMFRSFFHLVSKTPLQENTAKTCQKNQLAKFFPGMVFLWDSEPTSFSGVSGWSESGVPETKSKKTPHAYCQSISIHLESILKA